MKDKNMLDRLINNCATKQSNISGTYFSKDCNSSDLIKIRWDKYCNFWTSICDQYFEDNDYFSNQTLYEYNKEEASLRFTLNFPFIDQTTLNKQHKKIFVDLIYETISDTLKLETRLEDIFISVSESIGKNYIIDFYIPSIRVKTEYFNTSILPDFIEKLNKNRVKKEIPDFDTEWKNIISELNEFSPVFGFKYNRDSSPLKNIELWNKSYDEEVSTDISESFSFKKHSLLITHCSREINKINDDEDVDNKYAPIIYSSRYWTEITQPKIEENISKFSYLSDISSGSEQDMITYIIPLVNNERFEDELTRWQIGRCLYNIFQRDRSGLDLWNQYCSSKYHEENKEIWEEDFPTNTGINDHLSIRTIASFAKSDNFEEYNSWHESWMYDAVNRSLDKSEMDIAEVMYRYLWLDFIVVGKDDWYQFESGATRLTKIISESEFRTKFNDIITFYTKISNEGFAPFSLTTGGPSTDESKKDERKKSINEIIKKLKTNAGQINIMKHCKTKFYRKGVEELLNTNPKITSWGNCVLEIHNNNIFARPGKMEDFITKGSNIWYVKEDYSDDHYLVKELLYWFKTAFYHEELINFFLKFSACLLDGYNKEKNFYVFCGPKGNNSKSMIDKLFKGVFGVYAIDFPVNVLTDGKQDTSGPTPALAQAECTRYISVAEPDTKIPFQGSLIKRYTGNDSMFVNPKFKDGKSINLMAKIAVYTNGMSEITGADKAVEERLCAIPMESEYSLDAPEDFEEQWRLRRFPMDLDFEQKIKKFRKPMLWLMVKYYPIYCKEGMVKPKIVQDYTNNYWENNNPYKLFVNENLIKTDNPGDKITATNMYNRFKIWYSKNYDSRKNGRPDIQNVVNMLSSRNILGDHDSKRIWSCVRFLDTEYSDNPKHSID